MYPATCDLRQTQSSIARCERLSMSDVWEQLLSSAVLGVERRAFALPPAEGALGDLLGQIDADDPERALLAAAATVALFRRTGRISSIDATPAPAACEPDAMPVC